MRIRNFVKTQQYSAFWKKAEFQNLEYSSFSLKAEFLLRICFDQNNISFLGWKVWILFKNGITLHEKERLKLRDKRCSPQLDSRFQAFSLDSYNFCLLCSPSSACLRVYSVLKSSMQNSNWWNWVGLEQLTSSSVANPHMKPILEINS